MVVLLILEVREALDLPEQREEQVVVLMPQPVLHFVLEVRLMLVV
jgi:hypothetical protein